MSAIEYRHRVQVLARDADGREYVLPWRTMTAGGQSGESASFVAGHSADARREWRLLAAGDRPKDLMGSLNGWAGVWISPVMTDRRFASSTGKSSWSMHQIAEGTHEIRSGSFAAQGPDPRVGRSGPVLEHLLAMAANGHGKVGL